MQVRLVAFHSVGRLLFHAWIPSAAAAAAQEGATIGIKHNVNEGKQDREEEGEEEEEHEEARDFGRAGAGLFPLGLLPSSPTAYHGTTNNNNINDLYSDNGNGNDAEGISSPPACAEQALLRLSLILHETARGRSDPRVRAAARSLASGLRSRRRPARKLLARSALLVLDHGLANGSLDGLRERFPPATRPRARGGGAAGVGEVFGLGSLSAMSVSSGDRGVSRSELGGWGARGGGGGGGLESPYHGDGRAVGGDGGDAAGRKRSGLPHGSQAFVDDPVMGVEVGGGHRERSQTMAGPRGNDGGRRSGGGEEEEAGGLEAPRLSKDALQYASAVRFLVAVGAFFSVFDGEWVN